MLRKFGGLGNGYKVSKLKYPRVSSSRSLGTLGERRYLSRDNTCSQLDKSLTHLLSIVLLETQGEVVSPQVLS